MLKICVEEAAATKPWKFQMNSAGQKIQFFILTMCIVKTVTIIKEFGIDPEHKWSTGTKLNEYFYFSKKSVENKWIKIIVWFATCNKIVKNGEK